MKTIGVTGASGFVGRRLVELLLQQGYEVVALVRNSGAITTNVGSLYREIVGDINNQSSVKELVNASDAVIHLAAYVGHGTAKDYDRVNVEGTRLLCQTIVENKPECKLVNCSSIATLRFPRWFPWAGSVYARSKARADQVVEYFKKKYSLTVVTVYPGMIYGPGDNKFLPQVLQALDRKSLRYISGGESNAPLIYVDDLCDLFILATVSAKANGQRYIGVSSQNVGMHDFFRTISIHKEKEIPEKVLPKSVLMPAAILLESFYKVLRLSKKPPLSRRVVDVLSINLSKHTKEANQQLGWEPRVDMEQGLLRYFEA